MRFSDGVSEWAAHQDQLERGDGLLELLAAFVDGGAEAGRAITIMESQGGTIPALDFPMILFYVVVQVLMVRWTTFWPNAFRMALG